MKIAYFDCFSGASGDMILGALVDAGLSLEHLKSELAKLDLPHYHLGAQKVVKRGLGGTQMIIDLEGHHHGAEHHHEEGHKPGDSHHSHGHGHSHGPHHDHHHHGHHDHPGHECGSQASHQEHRNLPDIKKIIEASSLEAAVKEKSLQIFTRLAEAEARVHRTSIDQVHFHEVGAMDSIIDIVGAVIGFQALGLEQIYCSPIHVGCGTVTCAHGTLPVPAPATLELVKGKPIYATGVKGELLTPTGAAILTTLAAGFGGMPAMTVEAMGYGAGSLDTATPNLLRITIGEAAGGLARFQTERVAVIETNIDDMNPQLYDYLISKMLDLGALDVFLTPIQMKKNRPGTLLSVICAVEAVEKFADFLLQETTTIGLRWRVDDRLKADRSIREAETLYGPVRFKVSQLGEQTVNVTPEYDDCKRLALEKGVALREVMEEARAVALKLKHGNG
jgi:uncharacterized protein (TIGR00299 family) protein